MASGYRRDGFDFDDLFDADVMGDGPTTPNARSGGAPLRYAHIQYGSKRADVGYRQGGVDVSNLWAAKGTASYVSDGGLPSELRRTVVAPPGQTANATVSFSFNRDGTVTWASVGSGSGTWARGTNPGDNYDINYTLVSGNAVTGVPTGWVQLNANRAASSSVSANNGASNSKNSVVNIQIRRRSDGAVLVNRNVSMAPNAVSDG